MIVVSKLPGKKKKKKFEPTNKLGKKKNENKLEIYYLVNFVHFSFGLNSPTVSEIEMAKKHQKIDVK